ncbi:MAG: hypothetical protein JXR78_13225 [Victivallales bacterium]|nr:hypothetical protein [Victivallales bacterium]
MKKSLFVLGVLTPYLIFGGGLKKDLSFYSSFDGVLTPVIASGSKTVRAGKEEFDTGVSGEAAKIEKVIEYMAEANADVKRGTVAFWHKPAWLPGEEINSRTPFDLTHIKLNYIPRNKAMFFMTGKTFPKEGFKWDYGCQTQMPSTWSPGKWEHIAITWDKKSGGKKIYLNGKLVKNSTTERFPDTLPGNVIRLGENAPGLYDELFIWKRELDADEIAQLYKDPSYVSKAVTPQAIEKPNELKDLALLIPFDNLRFYVSFDKSPTPDKAAGSSKVQAPESASYENGVVNNSIKLNNGKVSFNSNGNIDIKNGAISFWLKVDKALNQAEGSVNLFRSGHLALSYQPKKDTLYFMTGKHNGENFRWDYSPNSKIPAGWKPGEWRHIVICWDEHSGRKELYIDGKQVGSTLSSRMPAVISPEGELFVGENFKGNIDELAYFDKPLSQGAVAAICASPGLIAKTAGRSITNSVHNLPFQKQAYKMLSECSNLPSLKFDVPAVEPDKSIIEPDKAFSIAIPVRNPSLNLYTGKVVFTLRDFWMKNCGEKMMDLSLEPGESKKIDISFTPKLQGIYKIEAVYELNGKKTLRDLSSFACYPLPEAPDPDSFFGNHVNGWGDGKFLRQAARLGQNWQRNHNMIQVTWWNRVQPDPGKFTWTYDFQLEELKKLNMPLLGQLFTTPYWAAAVPQKKPASPGYSKCWSPNLKHFEEYVYQTVSRYKDYIKYWEIWNEPAVGIFWKGDTKEFGKMVQVAVKAAKRADPNCVVMSAGYTCPAWAWHTKAAEEGAFKGLDIISFHYGCYQMPALKSYQQLGAVIDHFQNLAVKYGPGRKLPLWSTESGCSDSTFLRGLDYPQLPPESERAPLDWYAGAIRVVQGSAVLMSHNVKKHFFYFQTPVSPSASNAYYNTSMLDVNQAPRPKLMARAVMQSQLDWTRFHSRVFRETGRFWANVHESKKDKSSVIVLWCGDEGIVELKCKWPGKVTSIINIMGNRVNADEESLTVTEEPFYIHVDAEASAVVKVLQKAQLKVIKEPTELELNDGPEKADVPILPDFVAPGENIASNFTVDIRQYCTMGFADEKAGDGKGGWSDEGSLNDLRDFKPGKHEFYGVTFDIIDPVKNNGKSIITMRGNSVTPNMPEKVSIPINRKLRALYFLHAASWGSPGDVSEYVLNFADGTQQKVLIKIPLHNNNWWNGYNPKELSKPVPVKVTNTSTGKPEWRYLRVFELEKDPLKDSEVKSLDIISIGEAQTPIILGISGTL